MITILLDQNAIEEALTDYVSQTALGVDLTGKSVDIKLIAGRGEGGMRAEISIAKGEETEVDTSEKEAASEDAAPEEDKNNKDDKKEVVDDPDFFD